MTSPLSRVKVLLSSSIVCCMALALTVIIPCPHQAVPLDSAIDYHQLWQVRIYFIISSSSTQLFQFQAVLYTLDAIRLLTAHYLITHKKEKFHSYPYLFFDHVLVLS